MILWDRQGDLWEARKGNKCVGFVREPDPIHFIAETTQIAERSPKVFGTLTDAKEWIEWAARPVWLRW